MSEVSTLPPSVHDAYQNKHGSSACGTSKMGLFEEFTMENDVIGALGSEAEVMPHPVDAFLMGLGYYDNSADCTLDEIFGNAYSALAAFDECSNLETRNFSSKHHEQISGNEGPSQTVVVEGKVRHAQIFPKRSDRYSSKRWRWKRMSSVDEKELLFTNAADENTALDSVVDRYGSHKTLAARSSLNLIPLDDVQKRTLKTTTSQESAKPAPSRLEPAIEEVNEASRAATELDRRHAPQVNETRVKVASADVLRKLTMQKDMDGLRAVLTEERWPSFRRVKTFIADLFDVVAEKSESTAEIRIFVDDFASADNRAHLSNTVTLALLTRIVSEESIEAATAYAGYIRNLFLVKPTLHFDQHLNQAAEKLFTSALEKDLSNCAAVRCFCDTLVDLNYIPNSTAYLIAAMTIQLEKNNYEAAYKLWSENVRRCRVMTGAHLLVRSVLLEKARSCEKERKLRSLLDEHENYGDVFDALAEIVVELLKVGNAHDAGAVMRRVRVTGRHFVVPLVRLKQDKCNLPHVETFAGILAESFLTKRRKVDGHQHVEVSPFIKSVLETWQPQRKRYQKNPSKKKFKADAQQLHKLVQTVQRVWFDIAESSGNKESLSRLFTWSTRNDCEISSNFRSKYEEIIAKDATDL